MDELAANLLYFVVGVLVGVPIGYVCRPRGRKRARG